MRSRPEIIERSPASVLVRVVAVAVTLLVAGCKVTTRGGDDALCLTGQEKGACGTKATDTPRERLSMPPFLRGGADITSAIPSVGRSLVDSGRDQKRIAIDLFKASTAAALSHPEIRAAEARHREARAGVEMAASALYPQGDFRVAAGGEFGGKYSGRHVLDQGTPNGDGRLDATVTLRQLIYDFGATRADVERATYIRDAEQLKLLDKVDEIVLRTAQAYLKILEQRALIVLVDETIAAHRKLAGIVQANQREGNGTAADVNRVNARLTDMNAIRSDVSLALAGAEEQFHRLTKIHPGALAPAPMLASQLPKSVEAALQLMRRQNPRLGSMRATALSLDKEREAQKAGLLPKVNFEIDGENKTQAAANRIKSDAAAKALVSLRYKFMDGGLGTAASEQLMHRQEAQQFLSMNEDEQTSADIRQAFRAVESARLKERLVSEGVNTSRKVLELYLEQFKAGRRTVFELLDAQLSGFTVRRSAIESRFEGMRAVFEIHRHTGRLAEVLTKAAPSGKLVGGRTPVRQGRAEPETTASIKKRAGVTSPSPLSYPVSAARMPKRVDEKQLAAPAVSSPTP